MNRTILKLAMIVITLLILQDFAFGKFSVSRIADTYSPSVVTIIALDENHHPLSAGSGFFINTKGDLATNHHLFSGSVKAIIKTASGRQGEVTEIIKDDQKLDLTIAKTTLGNTTPLPLGDSNRISVGEDVVGIGNPEGLTGSISLGVIYDIRTADGVDFIQITAPILPGCSGGPVFNLAGEVIGVSTAFLDLRKDLYFAMPVNYLKTLKPTRLKLADLSRFDHQLEVVVRDGAIVELLDIRYNKSFRALKIRSHQGAGQKSSLSPYAIEDRNGSAEKYVPRPGTVYFKNGKKLICEWAWRYGDNIFLVVQGKKTAISYDENEIDIRKSFDLTK